MLFWCPTLGAPVGETSRNQLNGNSSGFTLVNLVVTLGLLGVVAIPMLRMAEQIPKTEFYIEQQTLAAGIAMNEMELVVLEILRAGGKVGSLENRAGNSSGYRWRRSVIELKPKQGVSPPSPDATLVEVRVEVFDRKGEKLYDLVGHQSNW